MTDYEEPDEIYIPTPEEVDEDHPRFRRRRGRSGTSDGAEAGSKRGFTGFLRRVKPDVGQNRGRAQPPPPSRPARPIVELEAPKPEESTPKASPLADKSADKIADHPSREAHPETPAVEPDVPPAEIQEKEPAPETPRLRKIKIDRPQTPSTGASTGYRSRNGAPGVQERAEKKGHVLGEFVEEWDGPHRILTARCTACGSWGSAVFEVPDGWSGDAAYVQYKGPATNLSCKGATGSA